MKFFFFLTLILSNLSFAQSDEEFNIMDRVYLSPSISYSREEFQELIAHPDDEYQQVEIQMTPKKFNYKLHQKVTDLALASSLIYTLKYAENDKKKHYVVGALIGGIVTEIAKIYFDGDDNKNLKAFMAGAGATIIIAALKEYRDGKGFGTQDFNDFVYTSVPGSLISFRLTF